MRKQLFDMLSWIRAKPKCLEAHGASASQLKQAVPVELGQSRSSEPVAPWPEKSKLRLQDNGVGIDDVWDCVEAECKTFSLHARRSQSRGGRVGSLRGTMILSSSRPWRIPGFFRSIMTCLLDLTHAF